MTCPFVRELTHEETIWIRDGDSKEDNNGASNGTSNIESKKSDNTRYRDMSIINYNILI